MEWNEGIATRSEALSKLERHSVRFAVAVGREFLPLSVSNVKDGHVMSQQQDFGVTAARSAISMHGAIYAALCSRMLRLHVLLGLRYIYVAADARGTTSSSSSNQWIYALELRVHIRCKLLLSSTANTSYYLILHRQAADQLYP